ARGPAGDGLPSGARDGVRPLHGPARAPLLQHAQGDDLRGVQRDPAQHHREGDARAMNFEPSDETHLLGHSLRKYLATDYSFDARAKIVASPTGWSEKVWASFA